MTILGPLCTLCPFLSFPLFFSFVCCFRSAFGTVVFLLFPLLVCSFDCAERMFASSGILVALWCLSLSTQHNTKQASKLAESKQPSIVTSSSVRMTPSLFFTQLQPLATSFFSFLLLLFLLPLSSSCIFSFLLFLFSTFLFRQPPECNCCIPSGAAATERKQAIGWCCWLLFFLHLSFFRISFPIFWFLQRPFASFLLSSFSLPSLFLLSSFLPPHFLHPSTNKYNRG